MSIHTSASMRNELNEMIIRMMILIFVVAFGSSVSLPVVVLFARTDSSAMAYTVFIDHSLGS